ncbi:GNAT family N-acetyltransferase [Variovorax soli]|jgi:ribosomal protein S18 acetylase RimI-like enzyme|uniref:GNAT family N-acetyltransferase n=1 Tax=Variovorax soli TaxID=376815 RepID=UPI00083967D2|nr:GNAT family N-acetyltransferase [Variovorax soli]
MPEIRRLTAADAPANRDLMLEAYERHPEAFTSSPSEYVNAPMTRWVDRLPPGDNPHSLVLGAFDDAGRLVGVAGLSVEDKIKARHKGTLFGMYVVPEARAQGLGEQLVQGVLAAARARPELRTVKLTVTKGNDAAQALYARCGFQVFGEEPMAVQVDGRFYAKVHMWCDLRAMEG